MGSEIVIYKKIKRFIYFFLMQYNTLFNGRNLSAETMLCLMKRVSPNIIEVTNATVIVTTVFITLVLIVLIILMVLVIYYLTKIRRVPRKIGIAPAALIAAAMGKVIMLCTIILF